MYGKQVKSNSYISRTYRIESELGSGGSGAIYLAWHTRLRKYVVVKMSFESSAGAIEVHRNEVEALKNIKSLFIPQVLDFMIDDDCSFTVMEYIEGKSFDKLLKEGSKFTESQVVKWYTQLASALEVIHKNDVCHRDIKPSNIMLTEHGDVCLIDFNSALVGGNNTGVISRSMGYASPEQYEYFRQCRSTYSGSFDARLTSIKTDLVIGDNQDEFMHSSNETICAEKQIIDWKLSDIYSLGATMYHFLTGKRPPVKPDEVSRISETVGYNEGLLNVIEKSMQTNPYKRYTSAEVLKSVIQVLN